MTLLHSLKTTLVWWYQGVGVGVGGFLGVRSGEAAVRKPWESRVGRRRIFEVKESGVGSLKSQGVGVGVGKSVNRLPSPGWYTDQILHDEIKINAKKNSMKISVLLFLPLSPESDLTVDGDACVHKKVPKRPSRSGPSFFRLAKNF